MSIKRHPDLQEIDEDANRIDAGGDSQRFVPQTSNVNAE